MNPKLFRTIAARCLSDGLDEAKLEIVAERLSKGIKVNPIMPLETKDIIALHLAKKFGWTLEYARSLRFEDIRAALGDEFESMKLSGAIEKIFDEALGMIERFEFPLSGSKQHRSKGGEVHDDSKN